MADIKIYSLAFVSRCFPWWLHAGGPSVTKRNTIGLSRLADIVLGKAIDKTMQVSDWERRPLSSQQLRYAAVDAHAALEIWRRLGTVYPAYASHEGLALHAFAWEAWRQAGPAERPKPGHQRRDPSPPAPPPGRTEAGTVAGGGGGSTSRSAVPVPAESAPAGAPPSASMQSRWLASCRKLRCIPHRAFLHGFRC